jgi:hypothetical protein
MATVVWDREKTDSNWKELLRRTTNPEEADKM